MNNIIKRIWEWFLVLISPRKQQVNMDVAMVNPLFKRNLSTLDILVESILKNELVRQATSLNFIASENLVSKAVLEAQNNVFINKYAEGYPGNRYYEGCEFADELEKVAIDRAKRLFKCEYANVQPHSGSQMNQAVMLALLSPGDTIMGMDLKCGGHLTHGSAVNISGMWFNSVSYGVDPKTGTIDMNEVLNVAIRHRPKLIIVGTTSYPRTIDWKAFRRVADIVDSFLLADISHIAGLVVTGLHPSPIDHCDVVTTTTHKSLRGPRGGLILSNNRELFDRISNAVFPGLQGGPMMNIIAAKAVAFLEAQQDEYKTWTKSVVENAKAMVKRFKNKKIDVVSNGTDNHLVMIDLKNLGVTGKQVASWLDRCYIISNKNTIPNDLLSVNTTSGLRLGTCACTSRGLKKKDFERIADMIADVILEIKNKGEVSLQLETRTRMEVLDLADKYPICYNV
ncbi:Serine hydroxymethyltransferase [Candidatus Hodgkinia cicadicola]|uniref:Serine hydroxymethyltransferase n=1 Tax=Candidatus Hodgkinia cicadicola TaxID=573658 RepID=A0ABX4MH20_9HYPH|nr:Serine hydroxymethyltransferase [Candidatus Hodgkinia cicadicola]PIM95364.1 Serine hydroxymethyltransferase [Candidatus Hodgkinia cicadicola]PIM95650.1 Serine hydroxymethyltransferase [Candidatus Hodgkinia cicadicola]